MNTYLTTGSKSTCYGCLACIYSCPTGALTIADCFDKFAYPALDTAKCVNCGKCKAVCPNDNADKVVNPVKATYALKYRDNDVRLHSSSGGAFTAITDLLLNQGYKVYGAAFDESFKVRHIGTTLTSVRDRMRGSKYVESSLEGIFPQIKDELENSTKVFFSGTPCQVAGLKTFLGKIYKNLVTADLICTGVLSPKIFEDYLTVVSNGSKIESYTFRDKSGGSWYSSEKSSIDCQDTSKLEFLGSFFKLYERCLGKRESCSQCKFAQSSRPGDITIADFWSISWILPEFEDELGVSLVIAETEIGNNLVAKLDQNSDVAETDTEKTLKSVPRLNGAAQASSINNMFWSYYRHHSPEKMLKVYGGNSLYSKLRRKPFEIINSRLKR